MKFGGKAKPKCIDFHKKLMKFGGRTKLKTIDLHYSKFLHMRLGRPWDGNYAFDACKEEKVSGLEGCSSKD